ncbi:MAG: hypothetical protein J1F11_07025 [Oscillospiraceae bacterium]|nr:hypothetical protein [Oscillospiraceae bacterium]
MSLYGINAYNSNSMYNMYSSLTSLMSGSSLVTGYQSNSSKNKAYGNSTADLYDIAKKAAMVKSPNYQKKMMEQLKSIFSGDDSSEIGTAASEQKVAENAKQLNSNAAKLMSGNYGSWTDKTSAVKSFVEQYNKEMESLADSEESADKGRRATLINYTNQYKSALESIGITVGDDKLLSIDSSKLNYASERNVKSLLAGDYSYGAKIGYNMDKVADSATSMIEKFVDSYNNTMDSLEKSDSVQALEKGVSLVNTTRAFARTLNRIGISVGSDNRLTVDKDKLAKSSAGDIKSLFDGNYSYAAKVADKAGTISRAASLSAQLSYNKQGQAYNKNNYASIFDMMFNSLV